MDALQMIPIRMGIVAQVPLAHNAIYATQIAKFTDTVFTLRSLTWQKMLKSAHPSTNNQNINPCLHNRM